MKIASAHLYSADKMPAIESAQKGSVFCLFFGVRPGCGSATSLHSVPLMMIMDPFLLPLRTFLTAHTRVFDPYCRRKAHNQRHSVMMVYRGPIRVAWLAIDLPNEVSSSLCLVTNLSMRMFSSLGLGRFWHTLLLL